MALLLISSGTDAATWRKEIEALLPEVDFRVWPETGAVGDIEMVMAWKAPPGAYAPYPNLKCICSLGHGVDHIFIDPDLPAGVPIMRLVDDSMQRQMSAFVLAAVLRHLCHMDGYAAYQRERRWEDLGPPEPAGFTVGVMGVGALGADLAGKLLALGFRVAGWSRTRKDIEGVESFVGPDGLERFLGTCDAVACLLPLTPDTRGILDARAFAAMKQGAWLINTARGAHVVDEDLIAALDSGKLAGATLDVFNEEPLPEDHAFWAHPGVTVTPHASAVTLARSVAPQIVDAYRRVRGGRTLVNIVDPSLQY